jgi:hypothetical protein
VNYTGTIASQTFGLPEVIKMELMGFEPTTSCMPSDVSEEKPLQKGE